MNINTIAKKRIFQFILALIVILTISYLTTTQKEIPSFLIGALGIIIMFYFGKETKEEKTNGEPPNTPTDR